MVEITVTVYALVHLVEIVNTNFLQRLSLQQYRNVGFALTYRWETKLVLLYLQLEIEPSSMYSLEIEPSSMHSLGNVFVAMALLGKIQ